MCHVVINSTDHTPHTPCTCELDVTIDEDWAKDVYMYYALTNFYQNHRRYVKSRDEKQLLGNVEKEPDANCKPYDKLDDDDKPIVPCGAIANSMFNGNSIIFELFLKDTFSNIIYFQTKSKWITKKLMAQLNLSSY